MLVDNKFFYISLPRCASTAFQLSCIKNNIKIQHATDYIDKIIELTDKSLDIETLKSKISHRHESCSELFYKFGNNYEIISVKRNRHVRFISCWEHVIDELEKMNEYDAANILKKLDENDSLYYSSIDILDIDNMITLVESFLKKFSIEAKTDFGKLFLPIMLSIQFQSISEWHEHNPNIIWFDFDKLYELEEWVSNKLENPFKLERLNSSKHIECNLKLTDNFIKKYNKIYDSYDFRKEKKTLI
jgi:RNA binding exosome subunit